MRVLYFSRDYSSHDYRFLTGMAKSGHTIGYMRLEKCPYPKELRPLPPDISEVPFPGENGSTELQESPTLIDDLKAIIETFCPDVILAGPIQRTAFLIALTGFQPLVSMSWGYDLLIDAKRDDVWAWRTQYTLRRSAALVCDSNTTRRLAAEYGMDPKKIVTFPWGVDLDHFSPGQVDKWSFNKKHHPPMTLLSTRSWEPIYGIDTLAEGFVKACRRQENLRLIMLNSGSQKENIHRILVPIRSFHTKPHQDKIYQKPAVFYAGHIAYSELPKFYRQADLYVAASHSDGASISMLEAMACGTPVLVSDIPGNREWVEDGCNGWLFPDGDSDSLASAIQFAFENRAQFAEMGRAARQTAEKRADWNKNFPNLINAFEIALGLPNGALPS